MKTKMTRPIWEIKILPTLNGHIVQVGCKTLCFETRDKLLAELNRYLENPAQTEQDYSQKYQFSLDVGEVACPPHPGNSITGIGGSESPVIPRGSTADARSIR